MPALRRIGRRVRKAGPLVLGAAVFVALLDGRFRSLADLTLWSSLLLASLVLMAGILWISMIHRRLRGGEKLVLLELEVGALMVVGAFALVDPYGRLGNPLYPLLYLLMAFLTTSSSHRVTIGLTLLAMAIESSLFFVREIPLENWPHLVARLFFLSAFAFLPKVALAIESTSMRILGQQELRRKERARREDARRFRLSSAGGLESDASPDEQAMWSFAAVAELEEAVSNTLEVASLALGTRAVSVFLMEPDDEEGLWLFASRPRDEENLRRRFEAKDGLLGAAAKRREPFRLCGEIRGIAWYEGKEPIRSVLIVPLRDERSPEPNGKGKFRGLLVADRLEAEPFGEADEELLVSCSREILRSIESEWVMDRIRKERKRAQGIYRAIEKFNRSTHIEEVLDTAVAEVRAILGEHDKDLVAVTTVEVDEGGRTIHKVDRVLGPRGLEKIQGRTFPEGSCLVSQAVKHRTILPTRPPTRSIRIFGEDTLLRGVSSLKVAPLKMGNEVLGTLIFGSEKRRHLQQADVQTLELLASQVAQSLQRARFYAQAQALADKDGLTGLANRRVFEERLEHMVNLAKRSGRPVTVIVADIDHFKTVNDTYGHLTGDEILRKVAKILLHGARSTDVVARYGGEEFILILSDTDMEGGKRTAERIREEIERTVITTSLGPLRCTMSMGIASFPHVPSEELLERADQALYHAKRMGRNCTFTVEEMMQAHATASEATGGRTA